MNLKSICSVLLMCAFCQISAVPLPSLREELTKIGNRKIELANYLEKELNDATLTRSKLATVIAEIHTMGEQKLKVVNAWTKKLEEKLANQNSNANADKPVILSPEESIDYEFIKKVEKDIDELNQTIDELSKLYNTPTTSTKRGPITATTNRPTTEPTTKPTIKPPTKPTTKPTIKPPTKPTTKPTIKPPTKPTIEPTIKPPTKPTTKPTIKPPTKPTTEPTIKPPTKPTTEPTIKPPTKPTTEPTSKPDSDGTAGALRDLILEDHHK